MGGCRRRRDDLETEIRTGGKFDAPLRTMNVPEALRITINQDVLVSSEVAPIAAKNRPEMGGGRRRRDDLETEILTGGAVDAPLRTMDVPEAPKVPPHHDVVVASEVDSMAAKRPSEERGAKHDP